MIIDIKKFLFNKNKKRQQEVLATFRKEREMIKRAMDEQAASKSIGGQAKEILTAEEIASLLQEISPSGHVYRINLDGAKEVYRFITLSNYQGLVDVLGHMEKEHEFLKAMCLIDKCEEFADYEYMAKGFKIFEYVVRHNKTNAPTIAYARQFIIEMRRYLEELNLL
jgi:hypothetical protein